MFKRRGIFGGPIATRLGFRHWNLLGAAALALAALLMLPIFASRKVIDAATGKPLVDVYVVSTYQGYYFAGVESITSCYSVDVARTDTHGRYYPPLLPRSWNPLLFDRHIRSVDLYKTGYLESQETAADGTILMVQDTGGMESEESKRLSSNREFVLRAIESEPTAQSSRPQPVTIPPRTQRKSDIEALVYHATHCAHAGAPSDSIRNVFAMIYSDERSHGDVDWGLVSNLLFEIESLDGVGKAGSADAIAARYEERQRVLGLQCPDIGKGPLWEPTRAKSDIRSSRASCPTPILSRVPNRPSPASGSAGLSPSMPFPTTSETPQQMANRLNTERARAQHP